MRVASVSVEGRLATVVVDGQTMRGWTEDDRLFPGTLDAILRQGRSLAAEARKLLDGRVFDPGAVTFRPPLAEPPKIVCIGLNYASHTSETPFEQPDYPTIFGRFNSSLIGHESPLVRPRSSEQFDYEGEMVVVIGKPGRYISKASALSHVAAYSIFNDASVRDYQFKSTQWTIGKNFDGSGAFGPWLVTADELPTSGKGLRLTTRLNGVDVQSANTSDLIFDVSELIATISESLTLESGDIIVSGTPAGIGHARKPPLYMKAGDVCEVEIEGIGILSNPIVDETRPAQT